MVFQPTSPVKSFAVVQRAASVKPKQKNEASTATHQKSKSEVSNMVSTVGSSKDDVPLDMSQADTQLNSLLTTPSTSKRSSWKRMSGLFQRSTEDLRTKNKLTKPNPNAPKAEDPDSPTDPLYDPETKTFRAELPAKERKVMEKRISKETTKSPVEAAMKSFKSSAPKVDMPPIAVTGPDEPRSFLDLHSSSDEETPIVQRASSVRVAKPQIVRHHSTSAGRHAKISGDAGQSMDKAGQLLGEDLKNPHDSTPSDSDGGPADALKTLEGDVSVDGSTVALPPTTPSRSQTPKDLTKETIVWVQDACSTAVESNPDTGVKSQEGQIVSSSRLSSPGTPGFNPLRANPLSDVERVHLSRSMSAPLPPNRNPNRRVQIRPSDLIIMHNDNDHRLFRESIVTTPYPNRLSMVNEGAERLSTAFDEKAANLTALPDLSNVPAITPVPLGQSSITPTPIEKTGDRFPSPSATQHLFLTLSLPSPIYIPNVNSSFQTSPSTTIEISITDPATFDDEALFSIIRKAYLSNLLGLSRRAFFSRTLNHATPGSHDMVLDASSFIAHLSTPKLGRKKKGWLIWLRNQQPLPKRASSMFSGHESGREPMYGHGTHHHSHSSGGSSAMSAYWSPTSANGVPRMPFSRIQSRDLPPRVVLHYRFSVLAVTLALLLVGLLSVMSTVLWVLFGVPGQATGEAPEMTIFGSLGWRKEAEFRVLTGLVLGIVVSALGSGVVGAWCLGGWVLL